MKRKRSAPQIGKNPDEIIHVSKVGTCFCVAISIIDTYKKQNMNIYETIKSVIIGKKNLHFDY